MGLDLRALAATGMALAKDLADQAFESAATVRLGRNTALSNPVTNTSGSTWTHEFTGLQILGYDDADERRDRQSDKSMRTFLVDRQDVLAAATANPHLLENEGQVVDDQSKVWEAYRVEFDPTKSVIMFYCER